MGKNKQAHIDQLLDALDASNAKKTYNIAADLAELKESLGLFKTRELAWKIDSLIEKYTTGEMAEVHEALVARCRAGDVAAIRLYNELQQADKTDETVSNNLLEAILASTGGKR